jgi:signal transduction histidine kinase
MQMDGSFIWLREGSDQLRIAAASEGHEKLVGFGARLTDRGVAGEAVRRGEPVISASPRERRKVQQTLLEKSGMEAVLAVPLIVRGEAIGALVFGRRSAAVPFSTDEQRRAMTISQPVAIALENARLFDATQRQQAALKALSTEVLRAQEEERRRLSRELHDGVAQSASALRLSLTALRGKLAKIAPPAVLRECDELILIAGDSATEVRRLSADLRPPILDELGLLPTLRAHVETMQRRSRLRIEFTAGELPALPAGYDINLYRIAQEALTNVIKHAKARHARVKLAADHGKIRLEITDDGAGFDPATVQPSDQGGLGLLGMRERAALFGGSLDIHSEPGAGCRLVITVPLPQARAKRAG